MIRPLTYAHGREQAQRLMGLATARERADYAVMCRYYARDTYRPRDARAYWLGAARELRTTAQ